MTIIRRRVDALERASGVSEKSWHIIHIKDGQSHISAFRHYRVQNPGRCIGPDDDAIWVQAVSVKRDVNGNPIPPTTAKEKGPSLAQMLRETSNG